MTFRKQPCYLHKQKQSVAFELCSLGLLKKASLKMCQTKNRRRMLTRPRAGHGEFQRTPGKVKVVYLFLGTHRRRWAAAAISLCLKMKFISERGWEGERCEETERMRKTGEWERYSRIALHCTCFCFGVIEPVTSVNCSLSDPANLRRCHSARQLIQEEMISARLRICFL